MNQKADKVPREFKREWVAKLAWPLVALGLLLLFNLIFSENFFKVSWVKGNLFGVPINILKNGSLVMLLSLGMTLVIATGGVDLSVGAVMAISGALAVVMIEQGGCPCWLAITVALAVSAAAGLWNGLLVAVFKVQPLVATLILMVAGRGIAQLITNGDIVTLKAHPEVNAQFEFLGNGFLLYLPVAITVVVVMLVISLLLTRKTAIGLFIESVGDNDTASRYSGVSAVKLKMLVYMFSGFCAGVAGLVFSSNIKCANSHKAGLFLELDAIMAVVIGGTALTGGRFFLVGSIVGALLIQTLFNTMLAQEVSTERALVPKALVVVAVCLLQSAQFRGMFVRVFRLGRSRRGGYRA